MREGVEGMGKKPARDIEMPLLTSGLPEMFGV